jgi:hypothetical protein
MSETKNPVRMYGAPRWWESAAGAPLAYFLVIGGCLLAAVLVKRLWTLF